MCYGTCRWEHYGGDCGYPKYVPSVEKYYPTTLCDIDMCGADRYELAQHEKDCISVNKLVREYREDQERREKNEIRIQKINKILKNIKSG